MKKRKETNKVIIHCSDSDHAHHDNLETIRKWHVEENGWADIAYHFVLTKDGNIHCARDLALVGAHCKGQNHDSIGICLTGKHEFSKEQFEALRVCMNSLYVVYPNLADNRVFGHHDFDDL